MRIIGFHLLLSFFSSVAFSQSPFVTPKFIDSYLFMVESTSEERRIYETIDSLSKGAPVITVNSIKGLGKLILALDEPEYPTRVVDGMVGLNRYVHTLPIGEQLGIESNDYRLESLFIHMDAFAEVLDSYFFHRYNERLVVILTKRDIPIYLREALGDIRVRLAFLRELLTYKSKISSSVLFIFLENSDSPPWTATRAGSPRNCAGVFRTY